MIVIPADLISCEFEKKANSNALCGTQRKEKIQPFHIFLYGLIMIHCIMMMQTAN